MSAADDDFNEIYDAEFGPDVIALTKIKDAEQIHSGQIRMAHRLALAYSHELMFVHGLGWYTFDSTRWVEDERGAAQRAVYEVLRSALTESFDTKDKDLRRAVLRCESAAGVRGILDVAAALPPFAHTVPDLDPDPYVLNTANGTLDLRTGELRDHDPADRITKITNGSYRHESAGDLWPSFIERILPDAEVREFVRRLAGVGLLGTVVEQVLAIFTGVGANGKSVIVGALDHALGDYAAIAEPDLFMHREGAHPTGEMDLRGVRWVVVSESDEGRKLATATVKRLTGGDLIKARRMRQDFVTFKPSHLPVLITNHLPAVHGDDPALWRRLRVVPFGVVIPPAERDQHLGEKLQLEADAIVTWAAAGYFDYVQRGQLDEPESVLVATDSYRRDSDAIRRFTDECCLFGAGWYMTTDQAYQRWSVWAAADGAEDLSRKTFGQALDRLGYPADPNRRRRRYGIGLQAEEAE
ncbi:MAG TPA: phage/plasmid primase, P4 family [Microlunatus sp.]